MRIKVNKKTLSLLASASLVLTQKKISAEMCDARAIMNAATTVNFRLSNTTKSQKIGEIRTNESVTRILSYDNGWDLVIYNNKIGYVCSEYFYVTTNQSSSYLHEELNDIVYTTVKLNFRLSPNLEGKKIETIKANEELEVIAIANNEWYLVRYNGKIGYVKAEFTTSLKERVNALYPNIGNIELQKYAYATTNVNLRSFPNTDSEILTLINRYESFRILQENEEWCLIKLNDIIGYVNKNYIKKIQGTFIIIDLSSQKIIFFKDNNILLTSNITTGKEETPTNIGLFKIYNKETNRYLIGEDYKNFVEYWMPFDGGIGLHDAAWRNKFGGELYRENGSHGCVNLPPEVAQTIYNNIKIGTKVLVHK